MNIVSAAVLLALATGVSAAPPLPGAVQPKHERPALPQPADESIFPIPPVLERPLGVDEGEKIAVKRFELKGATDQIKTDVRVADVQALLDKQRASRPEGFTIGQMQEAANAVTQYYREHGFILAQAFIPQQDVQGGVVTVQVLVGYLGNVPISNNKNYSTEILQRPFASLRDEPLHKDAIEGALLRLTDYPGLNAFGVFRPGSEVGETDLALNVQAEDPYEFAVRADNHGVESTGEPRLIGEAIWNNPTGGADRLMATVLQTFNPTDGTYGAINYERQVLDPKYTAGIGYSLNTYTIGQEFAALDVSGDTKIANVYGRASLIRSRNRNLYAMADFSRKQATVETDAGADLGEDDLSVLTLSGEFDLVDTRFKGINQGAVSVSHGFDDFLGSMDSNGDGQPLRFGGSNFATPAGGDFNVLRANFARLQSITNNHAVLMRVQGQTSGDLLTSLEQMSLGGPDSVRAYPVAEYLRDKALFASAEWVMNAPGFSDKKAFGNRTWGELFQFSVYADYAWGDLNDPTPTDDESVEISGAGVGFQFNMPGKYYARLDVASPITDREASNDRDPQYYMSARIEF